MPPQTFTDPIPPIYSLLFTTIDPLIALSSTYIDYFNPDLVLNSFIPNAIRNPAHDTLFHQHGAMMVYPALLGLFLLRHTRDIKTWKIMQASMMVVDLILLLDLYGNLSGQGRLGVAKWRVEDWGCVVITGFWAVVRGMFVAGVGLGGGQANVKRA